MELCFSSFALAYAHRSFLLIQTQTIIYLDQIAIYFITDSHMLSCFALQ